MEEYSDNNLDVLVQDVTSKLNKKIVLVVPLGVGKPIKFLNTLYEYVKKNPSIELTILTALSLSKPIVKNSLGKKFIEPILDRLYQDCLELDYEKDRKAKNVPDNINIIRSCTIRKQINI